jgi:RHS repeat-associated protein
VWRWDQQEPFGSNPADLDPDANSVAFDLPLRLPGQRYDKETGLHYNFYRDFEPSLGIYKESDLVGLTGGLNTYAYVAGDPLRYADIFGLARTCGTGVIGARTTPNMFFLPCCQQHDDCYDDCKQLPSKDNCDREFDNCTIRQCANRWIAVKFACEASALGYQGAMGTEKAQKAFDDARNKCSCKP